MRLFAAFFSCCIGAAVTIAIVAAIKTESWVPLTVGAAYIASGVGWGVTFFGGRR